MNSKYEPTNAELMDPESEYFYPDWWLVCELDSDEPWAFIVSDYQWSWEILSKCLKKYPDFKLIRIGHVPESISPKTRIQEALGVVSRLQRDVEDMISMKCVDLEFAWKWGEYQKAISILYGALPASEQQAGLAKNNSYLKQIRQAAREWYMLWFEQYKKERPNKRNSREEFHNWLVPILKQINTGERRIPEEWKEEVEELLSIMLSNEDGSVGLTGHFTNKRFHGAELTKALALGIQNAKKHPPHQESVYPH